MVYFQIGHVRWHCAGPASSKRASRRPRRPVKGQAGAAGTCPWTCRPLHCDGALCGEWRSCPAPCWGPWSLAQVSRAILSPGGIFTVKSVLSSPGLQGKAPQAGACGLCFGPSSHVALRTQWSRSPLSGRWPPGPARSCEGPGSQERGVGVVLIARKVTSSRVLSELTVIHAC